MPGRGRGTKRKATREEEPERLTLLEDSNSASNSKKIIDFETIISESLNLPNKSSGVTQPISNSSMLEISEQPKLMRCGGENLGLQLKIQQNEYINLAILLKGTATDLKETPQGALLGVDENGQIVAKPRTSMEKIYSIDKWTDSFLIFSSVYLQAFPEQAQDLIQYMFVIREAAAKHGGLMWRNYDEQFRLRQADQFMSWSSINSDLWLRCFSGTLHTSFKQQNNQAPPCLDFNNGYCRYPNCRYPHICSICFKANHGKVACRSQPGHADQFQVGRSNFPFRGSYRAAPPTRGNYTRGQTRGRH